MIGSNSVRLTVALACLACAGTASAQAIETKVTDNPKISQASCAEVVWQKELLAQHPRIAESCQEVVISAGD